ncbi:MAG: dTDP-4-dehydrorhamnose 3,5-epimerase [Saprospiraceae bacterium]
MPFIDTPIADLKIFEPMVWRDDRGYFFESYNEQTFINAGITNHWVQDNQARSSYGVLRGLHYQVGEYAQAKLVRVIVGSVFDVAVDIRKNSSTYGQWFGVLLTEENQKQLYVPRGFAHGYVCLSNDVIFAYKCDNYYQKSAEGGLRFDDPRLKIDWKINFKEAILSEKDLELPYFGNHR